MDGSYVTYECSHGYTSSHSATRTCTSCNGTGEKTTKCAHNVNGVHRYCSHYTNTSVVSHKICAHNANGVEHD